MGWKKTQRPIASTSASMTQMALPGGCMRSRLAPRPKRVQIRCVSWLRALSVLKAVSSTNALLHQASYRLLFN